MLWRTLLTTQSQALFEAQRVVVQSLLRLYLSLFFNLQRSSSTIVPIKLLTYGNIWVLVWVQFLRYLRGRDGHVGSCFRKNGTRRESLVPDLCYCWYSMFRTDFNHHHSGYYQAVVPLEVRLGWLLDSSRNGIYHLTLNRCSLSLFAHSLHFHTAESALISLPIRSTSQLQYTASAATPNSLRLESWYPPRSTHSWLSS